VREVGNLNSPDGMRFVKLSNMRVLNQTRLPKFIAQCEVDAIWRFPLNGKFTKTADGFGINTYPYYDLNYYSNGRGKVPFLSENEIELKLEPDVLGSRNSVNHQSHLRDLSQVLRHRMAQLDH
jgi:hypothetical protein